MCQLCGDTGWLYTVSPSGDGLWNQRGARVTKLVRCSCKVTEVAQANQRKLEELDGLTLEERGHRFDTTVASHHQTVARDLLKNAFFGIYTLQGTWGTGKSHLMHCVVNQARDLGRVAVYATMPDVLDYLRAAFNPKNEETYEERWDLLIRCDVLAIDELDEFKVSDWSKERFLRLIDERWRNRTTQLTLVALNGDAALLTPKVASRLMQGQVIQMKSHDMRSTFKDKVLA